MADRGKFYYKRVNDAGRQEFVRCDLESEETAIIAHDSWENGLSILLDDPSISHRIGALGSELIAKKYGSAVQIAAFEASFTLI